MRASLRVLAAHPFPDRYGADRMLVASVEALRGAGHDVEVVVPEPGPLLPHLVATGVPAAIEPFPVLRRTAVSPSGVAELARAAPLAVARLVRRIRSSGADVVYVNTLTIPVWLVAARLAGVPAVCHVREADHDLDQRVARALVAPLSLARAVVANSRHTAAFLRRHLVTDRAQRRVAVVYNGMAFPPPPPPVTAVRRLVLVGRLNPRKGQGVAVRAVEALRTRGVEVELVVAGSVFRGYEGYERDLRRAASRLEAAGAVRFIGFVEDVWSLLADSDAVLVPSLVESLGNVAIEGMAAGRPVVASAVGGLAEIVVDGATGLLVPPGDAGSLARAVERLVADPYLAGRLGATARGDVRARFSLGRYARELTAVVEAVAGRRDTAVKAVG